RVKDCDAGSGGQAPARECPACHRVVAAGYARCPGCGHEFPPPERARHEARASEAGVLSGPVTTTRYAVQDVSYRVHTNRGAGDAAPRTMRVEYQIGLPAHQSEWVCFEHQGYPRQQAVAWWRRRSPEPVPETAEEAVAWARSGRLAPTRAITVRRV